MSDPHRYSSGTGEGAPSRKGGGYDGGDVDDGAYYDDDDANDDIAAGCFYGDDGGGDCDETHDTDPMADLSRRVSAILVGAEELRRRHAPFRIAASQSSSAAAPAPRAAVVRPNTGDVVRWRFDVEHLCDGLGRLHDAFVLDPPSSASAGEPMLARQHPHADIAHDMWRSCHRRVLDVTDETFRISLGMREPCTESETNAEDGEDVSMEALRQDGQAAIARILELLLGLLFVASHQHDNNDNDNNGDDGVAVTRADHAVASYVQYQRQMYRHRAKSCVSELVRARQRHQQLVQDWEQLRRKAAGAAGEVAPSFRVLAVDEDAHDDDERGDGGDAAATNNAHHVSAPPVAASVHHAAAIATLLGMAAQLIHPLLSWRNQLECIMQQQQQQSGRDDPNDCRGGGVGVPGLLLGACSGASLIVHEQATLLVETVASWMADDHNIDEWMGKSASGNGGGGDDSSTGSSSLQGLDGLVEELAYSCHVVRRYLVLVRDLVESDTDSSGDGPQPTAPPSPLETLLHEWTWKYASLERHLAVQNWHAALDVTQPTTLVLGTSIRVPSFVEDGHYLSLRALQRAAGTALAVGTVAHALSHDVWSTEDPIPPRSVHDALTNRHGCDPSVAPDSAHAVGNSNPAQPPRSGDFASAFLDALDEDVHRTELTSPNAHRRRPPTSLQPGGSAPSSGNFLSLIGLDLNGDGATRHRRLDVEFCFLNGIHAAGTACRELVAFLDSLLAASPTPSADHDGVGSSDDDDPPLLEMDAKSLAMIQLAREELFRSSRSYDEWLAQQVKEQVQQNSQSLVALRDFFQDETYALTSSTIGAAESDDRLERDMMGPLTVCPFLSQLAHKLDADVCRRVGDELVHALVDKVILQVLWTERDDEGGNGRDHVQPKRFTELGALLLSKQVRMLQGLAARVVSNPELGPGASPASTSYEAPVLLPSFAQWERLSQVLTALQLEKPSDWLLYRYQSSSTLSPDELRRTLLLRTDFSREAISAVVNQVSASANQTSTA
jgi:hypothetical protein